MDRQLAASIQSHDSDSFYEAEDGTANDKSQVPNVRVIDLPDPARPSPTAAPPHHSGAPPISMMPYMNNQTATPDQPYAGESLPAAAPEVAPTEVPPDVVALQPPPAVHASDSQLHPSWLGDLPRPEHTERRRSSHFIPHDLRRSLSRVSLYQPGTPRPQGPHTNLRMSRQDFESGPWGHEGQRGGMEFPETAGIEIDETNPSKEAGESSSPGDGEAKYEEETKHIIVKWDGKDDREHVLNLNFYYRCYLTLLAGSLTLCTAFASSVPSGIVTEMIVEFNTSLNVVKASVFLFVGSFCVAPLLWAPLSEMFGRKIIFIISFAGFTAFNIGCAFAPNIAAMIVMRILAGAFGSSSMSNAPSMIATLFPLKYLMIGIVFFALAPIAGPCVGPIVSGYISVSNGHFMKKALGMGLSQAAAQDYANDHANWRWVFRVCAILSGVLLLLVIFTMPETLDGKRLQMKARRLRQETGDDRYVAPIELRKINWLQLAGKTVGKPVKMLFTEPMLMLVTIYISFIYGVLYLLFVAYPIVFIRDHNMNNGEEGLAFLGFFCGCALSAAYCLFVDQPRYVKSMEKLKVPLLSPERRLETCMIGSPCLVIALFWFAWTAFPSISAWSTIVAGGVFGIGLFFIFLSLMTYVTEVYLMNSASAIAANTVVRSAFGAGFPMFGQQMYEKLNPRWATTVLAFIALVMMPIPFVFYKFGSKLRAMSKSARG